ncbi:MAG TPA: VWA domain-containing protein [Terracidiphilus sp.]|jgi:VWFA-related protein|nr:VWA domain-containing protein [Terracidiphilus sp.]
MQKGFCAFIFLIAVALILPAQQPVAGAAGSGAPSASSTILRHITIDAVVTDAEGKPVGGLEPFDFKLLDNHQPGKVQAFRRTDGLAGNKFDPPVELIVVLDAVNMPYTAVTLQRQELERFLRMNSGKLELPTSILLFGNEGLRVQPAPSKDGNALAEMLDNSTGTVRARDITGGVFSLKEQFDDSFKAIKGIAGNEAHKPGRKILVWIGAGWPLLTERFFTIANPAREFYFHELVELTGQLREARVTVYNVAPIAGITRELYKGYLKPVINPHKMEIGDLALQVMAVQTGGRVLDPSNDLAGLILKCQGDARAYYTLTFVAPPAAQADGYHPLQVEVDQSGLTVRTTTGYYDQP